MLIDVSLTEVAILLAFTLFLVLTTSSVKKFIEALPNLPWSLVGPIIVIAALFVICSLVGKNVQDRWQNNELFKDIHDSTVQTEIALSYLWEGQNPYVTDYLGTKLESMPYSHTLVNPALYHFAYLPGVLLFSAPVFIISQFAIKFYDQRITQLIFLLVLIQFLVWRYYYNKKLLLIIPLLLFNVWFIIYFIHGLNDILVVTLVILALEFSILKKNIISAIFLGCALATKQSAWFVIPFFSQFVWYWMKSYIISASEMRRSFIIWGAITVIISFIIIFPFLVHNPSSFIGDTLGYQSGSTTNSYPIVGVGIGEMLYRKGIISQRTDYFPFWMIQLIVGFVVGWYLWMKQKKHPTQPELILYSWAILLLATWFTNRYFTITHLAAVIVVLSLAYFYKELGSFNKPSKGIV